MGSPRISVALATFNGARFLREQLDSLAAQSRLPDELVVGDDNSSDETLAMLEAFAATAPFAVRVKVNAPGLGPAANFARTIARCQGDLIFLCDQDDVWLPAKIETMAAAMAERPGCLVALHDARLVDGDGRPLGLTMGDQIAAAGADPAKGLVAGCCMAFDARLACLYDPAPATPYHDAWLTSLADRLDARAYVPEALIDYRRHGANVSQSYMSGRARATRLLRASERMRRAFARPLRETLGEAVAAKASAVQALGANRAAISACVGDARLDGAVAGLKADLARDAVRLQIHCSAPIQRPTRLAQALFRGAYRGNGGLLSLLRDLAGAFRT